MGTQVLCLMRVLKHFLIMDKNKTKNPTRRLDIYGHCVRGRQQPDLCSGEDSRQTYHNFTGYMRDLNYIQHLQKVFQNICNKNILWEHKTVRMACVQELDTQNPNFDNNRQRSDRIRIEIADKEKFLRMRITPMIQKWSTNDNLRVCQIRVTGIDTTVPLEQLLFP